MGGGDRKHLIGRPACIESGASKGAVAGEKHGKTSGGSQRKVLCMDRPTAIGGRLGIRADGEGAVVSPAREYFAMQGALAAELD